MTYNIVKLAVAGVLAVVLVVAIVVDGDNAEWAVAPLGLLVGYVIGNARVTSQTGNVAPIVTRRPGH